LPKAKSRRLQTGKDSYWGGQPDIVGRNEIADAISEAQDALGLTDLMLAKRAHVTVKLIRFFKRPLGSHNVVAGGFYTASARMSVNAHRAECLKRITDTLESCLTRKIKNA